MAILYDNAVLITVTVMFGYYVWPSYGLREISWPGYGEPETNYPNYGRPDTNWPSYGRQETNYGPDTNWPSYGRPDTKWPWGSVSSCPAGRKPLCPKRLSSNNEYYRHPTSCHYFIQCDGNRQPICKECPPNLYFNLAGKYCDYAQNVACGDRSQPVVQRTTPRPSVIVPKPAAQDSSGCPVVSPRQACSDTRDDTDTFLPHPQDPSCYYQCNRGTAVMRHCPGALKFSTVTQSCA